MKAAPTRNDRTECVSMLEDGLSVPEISALTKVRPEHVELIKKHLEDGTLKRPRDTVRPKTAIEQARDEAAALRAELEALKGGQDADQEEG